MAEVFYIWIGAAVTLLVGTVGVFLALNTRPTRTTSHVGRTAELLSIIELPVLATYYWKATEAASCKMTIICGVVCLASLTMGICTIAIGKEGGAG